MKKNTNKKQHKTAYEVVSNGLVRRIDEIEQLKAEIEEYKEFIREVERSLYHGPDLSDPEIMRYYISVFETLKKDAKDILNEYT